MKIFLDSGPIGLLTNPKQSTEAIACDKWINASELAGHEIILPEIIDYEIRRELIRARKFNGLGRLDNLKSAFTFLRIDSETLLKAAEFWAEARWRGQPTADAASIDIDAYLPLKPGCTATKTNSQSSPHSIKSTSPSSSRPNIGKTSTRFKKQ